MCRRSLKECEFQKRKKKSALKDLFPSLILCRRKELAKHIMKNLEINPTILKPYTPNNSINSEVHIRTDQLLSLFYSFDKCTVQGWMSVAPGTITCAGMGNRSSWKSDYHFSLPMKRKPLLHILRAEMGRIR